MDESRQGLRCMDWNDGLDSALSMLNPYYRETLDVAVGQNQVSSILLRLDGEYTCLTLKL